MLCKTFQVLIVMNKTFDTIHLKTDGQLSKKYLCLDPVFIGAHRSNIARFDPKQLRKTGISDHTAIFAKVEHRAKVDPEILPTPPENFQLPIVRDVSGVLILGRQNRHA